MECPYCREEIRGSALKCRYCGEFIEGNSSREEKIEIHNKGMDGGSLFGIIVAAIITGAIALIIG